MGVMGIMERMLMKERTVIGGLVLGVLFLVLVLSLLSAVRLVKVRASRNLGVNSLRSVTLTLTSTNVASGSQTGSGK
jgi:hypothetical protein